MTYRTGKTFAARMDDLARLTSVPDLVQATMDGTRHRHHLRWLSLAALVLATTGLVMALRCPADPCWVIRW